MDAKYKMIDHLAKKCKDEKYYCDECEKSFGYVSNLNQHKNMKLGWRKYNFVIKVMRSNKLDSRRKKYLFIQ